MGQTIWNFIMYGDPAIQRGGLFGKRARDSKGEEYIIQALYPEKDNHEKGAVLQIKYNHKKEQVYLYKRFEDELID